MGFKKQAFDRFPAQEEELPVWYHGVSIPDGYRFGLHNLRHSLSNWLVNSGTDVKTVQTMLRHSKSQTTLDLYTQGDNDNKISAQGKFCGLIVDQEAARKTSQVIQ